MDGSSVSSPLESPEAPITSSVATLQSAESLSIRRQVRHAIDTLEKSITQLPTQISLEKTPDTPSANISSHSSSDASQIYRTLTNSDRKNYSQVSLENSHAFAAELLQIKNQVSSDRTLETPSANNSQSSDTSQAFSSHFASEACLLLKKSVPETPSFAILTPSSEAWSNNGGYSDDNSAFKFGDEPWDISQFDYDLNCLNIDGLSQKSES